MDVAVCQKVLELLKNLVPQPALHVGSLALGQVPTQFDDLHVLLHEDSLGNFHKEMQKEFHLAGWSPGAQAAYLVPAGAVPRPQPLTPNLGYTDWVGTPCSLWIQLYTNWRHGPLLLVDLTDWFNSAQPIPELEQAAPLAGKRAMRPPLWALLLWQASLVTNCAADLADPAIIRTELDKLYAIATHPGQDWAVATQKAQDYDKEYLQRLAKFHSVKPAITAYAQARGFSSPERLVASSLNPADIERADLDYGVLYDLHYAFEALEAYHPGAVNPAMMAAVQGGTGARPRKLWYYPPIPGSAGELGIANPGFSIWHQVALSPVPTWQALAHSNKLDSVGILGAPPEGYWSGLTQADFGSIFP